MPRFAAPFLQKTSHFTFNGWALDGYLDIFWSRGADETTVDLVVKLLPELGVLTAMTVAVLLLARFGARRWEAA